MLVGRDAECAMIEDALEDARRGRSRVLVFAGEAGIGKTALLEYVRERAAGMRTLSVAAVESEADLAFGGLHALLLPALDVIGRIPERQRRALAAALALEQPREPDRLAACAGTLSFLAEVAEDQPLLVLVDDAQWLDRPTAEALAFAARRFAAEDLALLVTLRSGEAGTFDSAGLPEHRLAALGEDDSHAVLRELSGESLSPGVARTVVEVSAGNPLALVEIAGALTADQRQGRSALPEPLPATDRIRQAFGESVSALPVAAQRTLLVASAAGDAPVAAVELAAAMLDGTTLDAVERDGLLSVRDGTVVFRHPLLRASVYQGVAPAERRAAHRALAAALGDDPDRLAWQRSAAAEGPDEQIAAALEAAAERAVERGGWASRARALERAADLSPDREARARRLCDAARAADWAGTGERAIELCERALPLVRDPLVRADLVHQLVATGDWHGRRYELAPLEAQAVELEELDAERAAKLHMHVFNRHWSRLDYTAAAVVAERLESLSGTLGPWWRPRSMGAVAEGRLAIGELARAHELYDELLEDPIAAAAYAQSLIWVERYDDARRALAESLALGHTEGNVLRVTWSQGCSAVLELAFGEVTRARALASEARTLAEALDAEFLVAFNDVTLATTDALLGDETSCRARVGVAVTAAQKIGAKDLVVSAKIALGLCAVASGRFDDAVRELEPVHEQVQRSGLAEPSVFPYQPDLIEAYVRVGDLEPAAQVLERFDAQAAVAGRRWALAAAARCRGLLANADDVDIAFARALELHADTPSAWERARTELAYGERLRRATRRRDARPYLRSALELFEAAGAAPWRDRAAAELRATGETVPVREPGGREALTPQELQIALLVAEGRTNREIGASIFLSPKTVEFHLTRVYRKLDLHSRAELIRSFSRDEAQASVEVALDHA